jgi:hypothetical protein
MKKNENVEQQIDETIKTMTKKLPNKTFNRLTTNEKTSTSKHQDSNSKKTIGSLYPEIWKFINTLV